MSTICYLEDFLSEYARVPGQYVKDYMSIREAAQDLGVNSVSLWRWVKNDTVEQNLAKRKVNDAPI